MSISIDKIREPFVSDNCSPEVLKQHQMLKNKFATIIFDSLPTASFIVNVNREIVLFNQTLVDVVSDNMKDKMLGSRPGSLLHCGNTNEHRCGESLSCSECGTNQAMQTAFAGNCANEECMILSDSNGRISSYTFKVTTAPLIIDDDFFCIVHLADISDRKNKEVVEKIFLHDLMNAVNGITGAGTLLKEETLQESTQELADMVVDRATFMANEINAHRLFVSAENRQLEVMNESIGISKMIDSICTFYANSPLAKAKNISFTKKVTDFKIVTDKRILYRIMENLIKNGCEGSPINGNISIEADYDSDFATITVNNQEVISRTVAHQIFKRSFSTKGKGRGLGTYSVKLFTENYLSGKVWFDSSVEEGTNFYVKIPLLPNDDPFEN